MASDEYKDYLERVHSVSTPNEVINFDTGHTLQSFSRGEELEYVVEESNEQTRAH